MSSAISLCPEFDRHELLIYEEVARMPPFRRKTLVLIGAQGVGRRSLKNKLIMWDPDRYGTTVPCEWEPGPAGWGVGGEGAGARARPPLGLSSRGSPEGQGGSSKRASAPGEVIPLGERCRVCALYG